MIEYRKASADEIDLLAKIRVDFLFEANNISMDEKDMMYKNITQFMINSFEDGSFVSWVAVKDKRIIATSGVSIYTVPPNKKCPTGRVAYISNMFTYPEYRKLGITTKLFALTVEEAKKQGCVKILLNATDMGRPIYEKFGFKDTANDMVYYAE